MANLGVSGWPRRLALAATASALLIGSGCSGDAAGDAADGPAPGRTAFFTVDVPESWRLIAAGTGNIEQMWGWDCCGSDEPFTLVEADEGERHLFVSIAGLEELQGGLFQAASPSGSPGRALTVDGDPALLTTDLMGPDGRTGGSDLVVERSDDLAVRVQGRASEAELVALAEATVVPDDHRLAPDLEGEPVSGMTVVGGVDASGLLALRSTLEVGEDLVPGDDEARSMGWALPAGEFRGGTTASVVVVPAASIDLTALEARAVELGATVAQAEVDGRNALGIEGPQFASRNAATTLVTTTEWGAALVVTAQSGETGRSRLPSLGDLARIARTVRPVSDARWEAAVVEAGGGPGLQPNVGREEIVRGESDGLAWLLQTDGTGPNARGEGLGNDGVDDCLRLEGGERACAEIYGGHSDRAAQPVDAALRRGALPNGDQVVVIIETAESPTSVVRATGDGAARSAPLVAVPGHDTKAAVLTLAADAELRCDGEGPATPGNTVVRLEELDDGGSTVGCLTW
ncbi:MAG: hypothetical protein KDB24_06875 [Microthrixaceae bacterium]|nr:hypothetical protein [Microthrixaceae bacterium]